MPVEQYHDFPLASMDRRWDGSKAEENLRKWASSDGSGDKEKVDFSKLKQCYFWHEDGELVNFGQLKFPYCDIIDNKPHVVHNACQNALARLENSSVPDNDKPDLRNAIEKQLNRFSETNSNDVSGGVSVDQGMTYTKPTPEQLDKINKFALTPLSADDVFVFNDVMIDDSLVSSHMIKVHDNLLNKFMQDVQKGVGLLMNHNSGSLPVGRSFDAVKKAEVDENGDIINTLYGSFYIDLNRNTESGMTTNDIVKGIMSGTIFDTSIGFKADSYKCSICGNDIRDFVNCPHFPGEVYSVDNNGTVTQELCYAIVGDDGKGELLENSLVFAGACDRATIKKDFSADSVTKFKNDTRLSVVEDIKKVPKDTTMYAYMAKDGVVFLAEQTNSTRGVKDLDTQKLKEILTKYGVQFSDDTILNSVDVTIQELKDTIQSSENKIGELSNELSEKETKLSELEAKISELENEKAELLKKAELADAYKEDLINKTVEMGIRLQGNMFNEELFRKFLSTLSVDEIKESLEKFTAEVNAKYPNGRVSETKELNDDVVTRDNFETEEEFRAYVAEEARKYSKENNVSLSEATKIMYAKLKNGSDK